MNRYRFRLEPVLRVRRIQQDAARAAMVAARGQLDAAEADLQGSIERYESLPPAGHGAHPVSSWLAWRAGAERTAASVIAAGSVRELAAASVDAQVEALRDARRRVAALERLDERRREEHALASQRDEAAEVDDLVTTRHGSTS